MEGVLAITFIFGGGTLFLLSISPIGKAFAARIRGHAPDVKDVAERMSEIHEVRIGEIDGMRQELDDVHERLDFAERMLAQKAEEGKLAPPSVSE